MNLDLGILWIEDSFSADEERSLKRRVQDAGFIANIQTIPNGDSIVECSHQHQLYHLYDLILLDYRLEGQRGNELAPEVRRLFPSTNILFYSGSLGEEDLRSLIAAKAVDGVYCCSRTHFIERAGSLIDQTARSLDRLSGMRGLAMRVVAECDEIIRTSILSMSDRDSTCAAQITELDKDVESFLGTSKNRYEKAMKESLAARIETRVVDSAKLHNHFRRLTKIVVNNPINFGLDESNIERLRTLRRASKNYTEKVLEMAITHPLST